MIGFLIVIAIMTALLVGWSLLCIYILWRAWCGLFGKGEDNGEIHK